MHKIKIFRDHRVCLDFCLFNNKGREVKNKKELLRLSLKALDRYFADEYEIDLLVENAPKSKKELKV